MYFKTAFVLLPLLALSGQTLSHSGIDRANLDPSCKPCDDFWRYSNGGWLDRNPIPDRFSGWGTFQVLAEANRERMRAILEAAAGNRSAPPDSNERKIGDFYAGCMDTAAIEASGLKPIQADLGRIAAVRSVRDLGALLIRLQRGFSSTAVGPFILRENQDQQNSKAVIAGISAGGLSLPGRDYYFNDDAKSKEIRAEFLKHVTRMFELSGENPEVSASAARSVMQFETSLAEATLTRVQTRDPYATYHKMDVNALTALAPAFDWKALLREFHIPESTPVNVSQPEFMKRLNGQLSAVSLEDWKTWLRWRVLSLAAPQLSKKFFDESFHFDSAVLRGVKEQQPRWRTCAEAVDRALGEALGEVFVRKHFPPEAKRRMTELVGNLRATLREELQRADWLSPATRKSAIAKLDAFVAKVGYPEKWRDYTGVKIDRQSYFENTRSAVQAGHSYNLAKIGKPPNRNDWGMTPPTVNAYADPRTNQIVFPAGILQPPFFDMSADDAINYGAIGAVIGHEMGHHFDDQGSKFDADGNLKNWWTPEDRRQFDQRAACVSDQFDKLEVGNGLHHKGRLVLGEALGDLSGLTLAHRAYQRSLRGKPEPPVADGFTADQRFFLAFARIWGNLLRPEAIPLQLNTNPHPLSRFRANGTLQNMPEFHQAFQCKPGDSMVRPPEAQCRLW
jgi:putative endopeptidase